MAKKYQNKHFAKSLPRVGSTFAVAMAVTVALSNQASATELEGAPIAENPPAPVVETPPAPVAEVPPAPVVVEPAEVPVVNAEIAQDNSAAAADNASSAADNQTIVQENASTADSNAAASEGAVPAPEAPVIPDAPVAPEVPNTEGMNTQEKNEAVDDYNGEVGGYNENVDDYNDAADDYNSNVDDYNNDADAFNQQEQERFEKEDQAYTDYQEQQKNHEDAYTDYEQEVDRLEQEHKKEQDRLEDAHEKEQDRLEDAHEKEQDRLENEHETEQDRLEDAHNKEQDRLEKEHEDAQDLLENAHNEQQAQAAKDHLTNQEAEYNKQKEQAQTEHKAEHERNEAERLEQYGKDKTQAEQDHLDEQDRLKDAHDEEQDRLKDEHDKEQNRLKDEHDKEQDRLEGLYEQEKEAYENLVKTEEQIYTDVDIYNNGDPNDPSKPGINAENQQIAADNEALKNSLDGVAAESIEKVSQNNSNITVDQAILDTLGSYDTLVARQADLANRGAALDADERKDDELTSETYMAYLAEIQQFNEDVKSFNADIKAYNDAVQSYNTAVENYNRNKPTFSDTSTGTGTSQGTGSADWGNIDIDGHAIDHVDVKYQAAASKDATVNPDGTITYTDTVTQYKVTGVYTDKNNTGSYGLTYDNDGAGSQAPETQVLYPNGNYDEFGVDHNKSYELKARINPATGSVGFYVTLEDVKDPKKTYGIDVQLDANSVYAEGSYYKAQDNDKLSKFYTLNDKGEKEYLPTVTIGTGKDAEEYYVLDGQSVFVISALTCDGMTSSDEFFWGPGFHFGGNNHQTDDVVLTPNGIDLVLNLQTMIQLHQAANAQKVSFLGYELGKPAQAIKIERETYEELHGEFLRETFSPETFTPDPFTPDPFTYPEFVPNKYDPNTFEYEEFAPTKYEPTKFQRTEYERTEYQRTKYQRTKYQRTKYQREKFVTPEYKGPEAPTEEVAPPTAPIVIQHLNHIDRLQKLDELLYFVDPAPVTPEPIIISYEGETPTPNPAPRPRTAVVATAERTTNLRNRMVITDEAVPLAKAPKTGDLSGIWAVISGLSLGGAALLNRKRKEEE